MKEIKFRVWDKGLKQMIYLSEPEVVNDDFSAIVFKLRDYFASAFSSDRMEDLELMQYTGLKDKNGKEIYEGDIVYVEAVAYGRDMNAMIFWKDGGFWLRWEDGYESYLQDWVKELAKSAEVIGNIYENPELIKRVDEE